MTVIAELIGQFVMEVIFHPLQRRLWRRPRQERKPHYPLLFVVVNALLILVCVTFAWWWLLGVVIVLMTSGILSGVVFRRRHRIG